MAPKPLPVTYITALESRKRSEFFNDFKYPILDALTMKDEGVHENTKLDFVDIATAISFFRSILLDTPNGEVINGLRVYFASVSADGVVKPGKCGILTLILVATTGINSTDVSSAYYAFKKGIFGIIPEDQAREWVQNYQKIKRAHLFKTLCDQDTLDLSKETKHVYFSYGQIEETVAEMEYQSIEHGNIVKSFGIRFTSYTNQNYQVGHSKPVKHKRRLTIGFTFIDSKGNDIGIEDIDPIEFGERARVSFIDRDDTMDTGDPTPPPSTNNGENLDVSSD